MKWAIPQLRKLAKPFSFEYDYDLLNELVIKYKEKYKDYQILLGKITEVVFEGFASTSTIDKIIRAK